MFEKAQPTPFDFVTPDGFPKSYLFRTSDGAMGVLQVDQIVQNPSGLRLRYRIVPEPPPPPLVRNPNAGRMVRFRMAVASQEQRIKMLRERYGDNHPLVIQAQRDLDLERAVAKLAETETDLGIFALKSGELREQARLAQLREKLPDTSPAVKRQIRDLEILKIQIEDAEARRQQQHPKNLLKPATQPAAVNPTTQPIAKDFHL